MLAVVCSCWLKLCVLTQMRLKLHESCTGALQNWFQATREILLVVGISKRVDGLTELVKKPAQFSK